jgi:hypothetical protein
MTFNDPSRLHLPSVTYELAETGRSVTRRPYPALPRDEPVVVEEVPNVVERRVDEGKDEV